MALGHPVLERLTAQASPRSIIGRSLDLIGHPVSEHMPRRPVYPGQALPLTEEVGTTLANVGSATTFF